MCARESISRTFQRTGKAPPLTLRFGAADLGRPPTSRTTLHFVDIMLQVNEQFKSQFKREGRLFGAPAVHAK